MPETRAPRLCHAGVAGVDIRNRSLRGFCPHWGRALVDGRDGAPAGPARCRQAQAFPLADHGTGSREAVTRWLLLFHSVRAPPTP